MLKLGVMDEGIMQEKFFLEDEFSWLNYLNNKYPNVSRNSAKIMK